MQVKKRFSWIINISFILSTVVSMNHNDTWLVYFFHIYNLLIFTNDCMSNLTRSTIDAEADLETALMNPTQKKSSQPLHLDEWMNILCLPIDSYGQDDKLN